MIRSIVSLALLAALCVPASAATYSIIGHTDDNSPLSSGSLTWVGQNSFRVGGYNADNDGCGVYVFELPALDADEAIVTANFEVNLNKLANSPGGAGDLYGLGYRTASTVFGTDFYQGDFGADATDAWPLQDDFLTLTTPVGMVSSDEVGDAALTAYLVAQYDAGAVGGNWVFIRINPDIADVSSYHYWEVTSANGTPLPVLTIETGAPGPEANAGADQTVQADINNNPVAITLDGSASAPDDSPIANYSWTVAGQAIATGVSVTADFAVGVHTVTLTVTDGEGDTDADNVVITIEDGTPIPPSANAGADVAMDDDDGDGFETVTLDGSASQVVDPRATLVSAAWTDKDGVELGTDWTLTVTLAEGFHPITLTVTDSFGSTDSDIVNVSVGREQLLNLPGDRPAFPVPADITWPETVGDPHICLWYGDKFAALSVTIDDNILPDQAWWMTQADLYDFTPTWCIIVGGIEAGSNPSMNGTWPDYVNLHAMGGDVQSHTMSHHNDDDVRSDEEVHYEYGQSQALIEANIPNHRCLAVAYPYGKGNLDIAREYFIAGRGTNGTPNKPGKINWMMTCSSSGRIGTDYLHSVLYGTSTISWLNSDQWKRAWLCSHFHMVQDRPALEADLAYIDSLRHLIWWGSFVDVARFGQERDSAEIEMVENTESRIAFKMTDRMNDLIFDHPLTIKVRIPDAWAGSAKAVQDGAATGFELATEGAYDYILLDAVPDRGLVEILPGSNKPGDANGDGFVDLEDFVILKTSFGQNPLVDTRADFDGDGDVDLQDFVILKTNFGS